VILAMRLASTFTRSRALALCAVTALALPSLPAQEASCTLADLIATSDVIATARTDGIVRGQGDRQLVAFTAQQVLAGSTPPSFALDEPAGESCGRALFGLAPGEYLLFLVRENGGLHLTVRNRRALLALEDDLLAHVTALLGAATEGERVALLAAALASPSPRARHDAALALARSPALEGAAAADRARIAAALADRMAKRAGDASALLLAAERLRLAAALDFLVEPYLSGAHDFAAPLLERVIPQLGGEAAAQAIATHLPADRAGRLRAARLLARLPAAASRAPLMRIAREGSDAAAITAGVALLIGGTPPDWLRANCHPATLREIEAAALAPARPVFRSILQRR
jgi:hypothetical protein